MVALGLQIVDGPRAGLIGDTVDQGARQVRGDFGIDLVHGPPPGVDARHQMVEEMGHPALAAGQRENHMRAEQGQAQARPLGDGGVDIGDRGEPVFKRQQRLAPQRRLQAVGQMAGHFLVDADRVLADVVVKPQRPVDQRRVGVAAADNLDQGNQMRRVERMADDEAGGVAENLDHDKQLNAAESYAAQFLDKDAALSLKDILKDKYPTTLELFKQDIKKYVELAYDGLDQQDLQRVHDSMHTIKSVSMQVGLIKVHELAAQLESICGNLDTGIEKNMLCDIVRAQVDHIQHVYSLSEKLLEQTK